MELRTDEKYWSEVCFVKKTFITTGTEYYYYEPLHYWENVKDYKNVSVLVQDDNFNILKNYLEGNGTQWISTKILPSISLKTHIGVKMNKATGNLIFGRQDKIKDLETYRLFNYQEKIYFDINGVNNRGRIIGAANSFMNNKYYEFETGNKYVKDLNSGYVVSGSPTTEFSFTPEEKHTINLYGDENYTTAYASGKIYFFKMWDNDTLVRHFVPVPCGLKIGDFVVPENGMWDIVEQKFYGNMGTGEFIYGVDE